MGFLSNPVSNFSLYLLLLFFLISFELISVAESPTDITSLEEVCRRVSAEEGNGWVYGEDGWREEKGGRRREGVERGEGEPLL
ncbi:hypothetical protein PS1_002410 [Malus domestica]